MTPSKHTHLTLDALRTLVRLQDELLACYRLSRHPSERVLDGITSAREALAELDANPPR